MRSIRIILYLLFVSGIISTGCKTMHSDESVFNGEINQFDRSGNKQGPWKIYEDSVLIAQGIYIKGTPDGLWTYWYPNGQLKEEGRYDHGIKTGMWVEWYEDGECMWKGEWENSKRQVAYPDAKAEIRFIGKTPGDNILTHDSTYYLNIRIQNIPVKLLFVETNSGSISRQEESDIFILNTSSDTSLTLSVGYIPDLDFKDFRNLVREFEFKIR